jgi:hypothetical protein
MGYRVLESSAEQNTGSDEIFALGDSGEGAIVLLSAANSADATEAGVIEGSPDHSGTAANSLVISNIANDGDIQMLVSDAGASKEFLYANGDTADLQVGHGMATVNIKTASGAVTMNPGTGVVVGHTSQETISIGDGATDLVPGVQILGTGQVDASLMLAAFSATATAAGAPLLALVKSGDAAIDGTHVVVTDGEELGNIIAYGDDGTDLEAPAAMISFEVDGTPGTGDMPGRILFATTTDGGEVLTERMRINALGNISSSARTVTVSAANATNNTAITVENTSNNSSAAEHAYFEAKVGGTTTEGDPHIRFVVPSGKSYYMGIDNTHTADALEIGLGTTVGTTRFVRFDGTNSGTDVYTPISFSQFAATGSNSANSSYVGIAMGSGTFTLSGTTTATRETSNIFIEGMTIAQTGGSVQVDRASAIELKSPIPNASVTIVKSAGLHINSATETGGGVITDASAIYCEAQSVGANNYGIFFSNDIDDGNIYSNAGGMFISTGADDINMNPADDVIMNFGSGGNLTLDQGTNSTDILQLHSSDITHGMTTSAPTNVFATFRKVADADGGAMFRGYSDAAIAMMIESNHTSEDDDKTSSANGSMMINVRKINGTGGASPGSNANLLVIDSDSTAMFLFDEEGSFYATANGHTGDVSVGALADSYDDAQLVRAFDHAKSADGAKGLIRDKWDEFIQYNEQDLVDAGVLGATLAEGGLLNVTGLQRLHNGAIWQGYVRQQEMQTRIESIENKLLALGA